MYRNIYDLEEPPGNPLETYEAELSNRAGSDPDMGPDKLCAGLVCRLSFRERTVWFGLNRFGSRPRHGLYR